ncbi:MAG: NADH-quinone oxidoreductase subunit L [Nocardioidaceae bacterium]
MTLTVLLSLVLAAGLAIAIGHRDDRLPPVLGVVGSAVAWAASIAIAAQQWGMDKAATVTGTGQVETGGLPISITLRVDQLSASMLVLATTVALLVQVYSVAYLRGDPRYPSYTAFVSVFTAAMALVVMADDLFVLLVGWEVMGACSYVLISHHWELEPARAGAVKAFVMTRLGDIGLLFGFFVLGNAADTFRISGIVAAAQDGAINEPQATAAALLVLCGVVGKSAQFPLHSWLPDAMPGPTPISALIHAATMVAAGVFLVARLLPVFMLSAVAMNVLAVIACVTMLGAALFALAADDLKRVLAWSTVSQLAYMFAALSLGGYAAGVEHLFSHGAFKALLFLAAGSVIHAVGTQRLDGMGGLRSSMPVTFVTMTIGFAALAGVPPFVGFFSKDAVLGVAADQAASGSTTRGWLVLVVGVVVAGLTAAYATRAWLMMFFGPRRGVADVTPHESGWLMLGPLVVLAGLTAVGGAAVVWPGYLGVEAESAHLWVVLVSLAVAAVGGALTVAEWLRVQRTDPAAALGRLRPVLTREARFDDLVGAIVVRPTGWASRFTRLNEEEVVEAYVGGADAGSQWAARLVRWTHNGNAQRYVTAVVVGAVAVAVVIGVVGPS